MLQQPINFNNSNWTQTVVRDVVEIRRVDNRDLYQILVGGKPLGEQLRDGDPRLALARQFSTACGVAVAAVASQAMAHAQQEYERQRQKRSGAPEVKMITNRIPPEAMR